MQGKKQILHHPSHIIMIPSKLQLTFYLGFIKKLFKSEP